VSYRAAKQLSLSRTGKPLPIRAARLRRWTAAGLPLDSPAFHSNSPVGWATLQAVTLTPITTISSRKEEYAMAIPPNVLRSMRWLIGALLMTLIHAVRPEWQAQREPQRQDISIQVEQAGQ
jgi:hypothetical protein